MQQLLKEIPFFVGEGNLDIRSEEDQLMTPQDFFAVTLVPGRQDSPSGGGGRMRKLSQHLQWSLGCQRSRGVREVSLRDLLLTWVIQYLGGN